MGSYYILTEKRVQELSNDKISENQNLEQINDNSNNYYFSESELLPVKVCVHYKPSD